MKRLRGICAAVSPLLLLAAGLGGVGVGVTGDSPP
jgi:hypothetical protein